LSETVTVIVAEVMRASRGIVPERSHWTSTASSLPLPPGVSPLTEMLVSPPFVAVGAFSSSIVSRVPA
jgi:hypothetical protein